MPAPSRTPGPAPKFEADHLQAGHLGDAPPGGVGAGVEGFNYEAANAGLTLLGRGEFSLILATFATAAGLDERIGPFVALYVLVLAISGPLLASRSEWATRLLPFRLGRHGEVDAETPTGSLE
jgi:monovalent cation:H+ antiporter-2, CPA2 family